MQAEQIQKQGSKDQTLCALFDACMLKVDSVERFFSVALPIQSNQVGGAFLSIRGRRAFGVRIAWRMLRAVAIV